MLVMIAGTIPRNLIFAANLRYYASVPWALASFVLATLACANDESQSNSASAGGGAQKPPVRSAIEIRCYRSPQSVLLGPSLGQRNSGRPPGWIRLEWMPDENCGAAELVDASAALPRPIPCAKRSFPPIYLLLEEKSWL